MRVYGMVLVVVGALMMVMTGFNFKTEKKVLDIGPLEVNKEENHRIGWPVWAGGVAIIGGIALIAAGRKK